MAQIQPWSPQNSGRWEGHPPPPSKPLPGPGTPQPTVQSYHSITFLHSDPCRAWSTPDKEIETALDTQAGPAVTNRKASSANRGQHHVPAVLVRTVVANDSSRPEWPGYTRESFFSASALQVHRRRDLQQAM